MMAQNKAPKQKKSQQAQCARKAGVPPDKTANLWSGVELTMVSLAWIVLVATVWAEPRPVGDYFIALAAGRDMMASGFSCLTQPDTWAFTTSGKVWLNQNWGTHLLYFLAYDLGGGIGAMALKGLALAVMAGSVVMVCRQRGVGWPVAILAGGVAVAAGRSFIDLRPNLMTFMLTPLTIWLLYRSRRRPRRVWAAAVVAVLWANVHGGFMFGLGMVWLWALCWIVTLSAAKGVKTVFAEHWHMPAAAAAATVASGVLSPYGIENLTHPFLVGQSAEWRTISEWRPLYEASWFGSTWEFYAVMILLVVLPVACGLVFLGCRNRKRRQLPMDQFGLLLFSVIVCAVFFVLAVPWQVKSGMIYDTLRQTRWMILVIGGLAALAGGLIAAVVLVDHAKGKDPLVRPKPEALATLIFELCLAAVVIVMAVAARRFIPLAILILTPMAAIQAQWLLDAWGRAWPLVPAAVALVIPALFSWQGLYRYYHPDNPLLPPHTVFQRMMAYGSYPSGAAEFIHANDVKGNAFNEWTWEGYLRWRCPQVKLFLGGRAQQVYSLETHRLRNFMMRGGATTAALEDLGVRLAVIPDDVRYQSLAHELVAGPDSRWAYIYSDGDAVVLANGSWEETRKLIDRAASGDLEYPDPGIAGMSRARCLSSPVVGAEESRVIEEVMRANTLSPTPKGYQVLKMMVQRGRVPEKTLLPYLHEQNLKLEKAPVNRAGGFDVLICRQGAAEMLAAVYSRGGDRVRAARWSALAADIGQRLTAMQDRWQGKYALICYPYLSVPTSEGRGVQSGMPAP